MPAAELHLPILNLVIGQALGQHVKKVWSSQKQ